MTRAQLLKKRAYKAHRQEMYSRHAELSSYNPTSAYDRITRLTHVINEIDSQDDPGTYIDRQIQIRRLERDILAISEHMMKNCPKDMIPYFKEKHESALAAIARCNERIK